MTDNPHFVQFSNAVDAAKLHIMLGDIEGAIPFINEAIAAAEADGSEDALRAAAEARDLVAELEGWIEEPRAAA